MQIDYRTEAFATLRQDKMSLECECWTEADTRSKLIDHLFLGCLGWKEPDVRREVADAGNRLDYEFSLVLPTMVVEAKKAATDFPMLSLKPASKIQLRKLMSANPTLGPYLKQVAGYCHLRSMPFAVLTNGISIIAFLGKRDDRIPLWNGDAIVIPSIFAEELDFQTLHELLSREAVSDGRLNRELCAARPDTSARSILSGYVHPDATVDKNPLSTALEPILSALFTDLLDEDSPEILQHCYVKPGEARLRDEYLEYPLLDKPPVQALETVDVDSRNAFTRFGSEVNQYLSAGASAKTILVIGDVGVGKTMFLRRFFSPTCNPGGIPEQALHFFIDFRAAETNAAEVSAFVWDRLFEQLMALDENGTVDLSSPEALQQVFRQDVRRFERRARLLGRDEGEYNKQLFAQLQQLVQDRCRYVQQCFLYLRTMTKHGVCIVLDNADHHGEELQRVVYLTAKRLQVDLHCLVLVSLQESWFWHFKDRQGPLAAYQDTVFHIPAPRMKDVLHRRLEYAIERLPEVLPRQLQIDFGNNIVLEPKQLSYFLESCKAAFFTTDDTAICYECLANGNVRRGLDLFCRFVRSGHTTVSSYLSTVVLTQTPAIKRAELITSIARGEFLYYSGTRSPIPNVFTQCRPIVPGRYPRFATVFVLQLLASRVRDIVTAVGRGFVDRPTIAHLTERLGISAEAHAAILDAMIASGLAVPNTTSPLRPTESQFLRISAMGLYLLRNLLTDKAYLEGVMLDTPIVDDATRNLISRHYEEGAEPISPKERDQDILAFVSELDRLEKAESERIREEVFIQEAPTIANRFDSASG